MRPIRCNPLVVVELLGRVRDSDVSFAARALPSRRVPVSGWAAFRSHQSAMRPIHGKPLGVPEPLGRVGDFGVAFAARALPSRRVPVSGWVASVPTNPQGGPSAQILRVRDRPWAALRIPAVGETLLRPSPTQRQSTEIGSGRIRVRAEIQKERNRSNGCALLRRAASRRCAVRAPCGGGSGSRHRRRGLLRGGRGLPARCVRGSGLSSRAGRR